jgi:hypothetical protein
VYPPNLDFQYGDWWQREFARGDNSPWRTPNPDLAVMLASARERSEPLVGPELGDMLDPIPRADIHQAMLDGIPDLLADLESLVDPAVTIGRHGRWFWDQHVAVLPHFAGYPEQTAREIPMVRITPGHITRSPHIAQR